jgi:Zn-dependent peptidase ImmA (M78 family)
MKLLAAEKRQKYSITTAELGLKKIREVYKAEGIAIDLWDTSHKIRAMYMCDGGDPSVLVNRNLPTQPRLFAMTHELKHHYCDQTALKNGRIRCGDYNANEVIEKAAEVALHPANARTRLLPARGRGTDPASRKQGGSLRVSQRVVDCKTG